MILGESAVVKDLLSLIRRVGQTKTNILIVGESGTGKELVARMIHETGALRGKPFVPVNCGAIPETLIESELFGHRRGSFTGAVAEKMGLFEAAHTGTLFLDEVGELPLGMQVKLLRAIQDRAFRKVGGTDDVRVDVRIIAATNRDLESAMRSGTFREDLYYRLNVILIKPPPLRDRPGDVGILAEHFLSKFAQRWGKKVLGLEADALGALEQYKWPGNVRELENVIERAVTLETGSKIKRISLPAALLSEIEKEVEAGIQAAKRSGGKAKNAGEAATNANGQSYLKLPAPDFSKGKVELDEILGGIERTYLKSALEEASGVKKKAADLLGITFRSMRYRLKKLGMEDGGG